MIIKEKEQSVIMEPTFYDRSIGQVLDAVGANRSGLSSAEAEER